MKNTTKPTRNTITACMLAFATGCCLIAASTISANAATVKWSSASQTVGEAAGTATITATLDGPAAGPVTIPYVVSGTANGADHSLVSGSLVINEPNTTGQITFVITDDMLPEVDETVVVQMGVVTGATAVAPTTHIVRIKDNDLNRDTAGLSFCIAFPGNRIVPSVTDEQVLELFLVGEPIASATQITGTVSVASIGFFETFTVEPGIVTKITVPTDAAVRTSDVVEVGKAVIINADAPITVYGLNTVTSVPVPGASSSDGFLAFPEQTLGNDYLVMSNTGIGNQFTVVGAADGTTVSITPSIDIVPGILQGTMFNGARDGNKPAGDSYDIVLNRGDVYQVRHGLIDAGDFTGTSIVASKSIAVFGGDLCGEVPYKKQYCDHLVEQLTPTCSWGKSYQTMPFSGRFAEVFRFMASEDNTQIDVSREDPPGSGNIVTTTVASGLMRGEFVEFINGEGNSAKPPAPLHIQASAPILAAQMMPGTTFDDKLGDPSMMILAQFEQYLPSYTIATPPTGFDTHYINLVVSDLDIANVSINGDPISGFTATPFTAFVFLIERDILPPSLRRSSMLKS